MSKRVQKLTASAVKQSKSSDRAYKMADGGGLYLHVKSSGKYWRYKYRFEGTEKLLALGVFPDISLADVALQVWHWYQPASA